MKQQSGECHHPWLHRLSGGKGLIDGHANGYYSLNWLFASCCLLPPSSATMFGAGGRGFPPYIHPHTYSPITDDILPVRGVLWLCAFAVVGVPGVHPAVPLERQRLRVSVDGQHAPFSAVVALGPLALAHRRGAFPKLVVDTSRLVGSSNSRAIAGFLISPWKQLRLLLLLLLLQLPKRARSTLARLHSSTTLFLAGSLLHLWLR
mmetsp:Transcript_26699/g.51779  ORF Transcript_26699/g.51779 Transcript_26699/m.51779 type:complete len:205 (+) Transcript_26699:3-617(+)